MASASPAIGLRYWPRVVVGLLLSACATLITLPERLAVGLLLRVWRPRRAAPVFILGYYRSGTTFLQFLLDRDPGLASPKWNEALAPQGFLMSWTVLRFVLLPFLGSSRPQDNVSFGSDYPAEDDFALCNWSMASSLPSRHVTPSLASHYQRFDSLDGLTPGEHARWAWHQRALVDKLGLAHPGRRALLKSPCHTGRVRHLLALFGPETRFIHISRHPHAVLRSNTGLFDALDPIYHLEDPVSREEIERRILDDYLATEARFEAEKALIPPGRLARIRLPDLQADPLGEVDRVYRELGLPLSRAAVEGIRLYLDAEKDFQGNRHPGWTDEEKARLEPALAEMTARFEAGPAARPRVEPGLPAVMAPGQRPWRLAAGVFLALATGVLASVGWGLAMAWFNRPCHPLWCWPIGVVAGLLARWPAGRGAAALGAVAVAVSCGSFLAAALVVSTLTGVGPWTEWLGNPVGLPAWLFTANVAFWWYTGGMCAWKLATRRW